MFTIQVCNPELCELIENQHYPMQVDALIAEQEVAAKNASQLQASCMRKDGALREQRSALESLHVR